MARVLSVLNPTLNIALVEREALLCRAENSKNATMKIVMILTMLLAATISWAQSDAEEAAIRKILDEEVAAWNKGDADAYSRQFRLGRNVHESAGNVLPRAGGFPGETRADL